MGDLPKKRITMKRAHPNPLFEEWLLEWRNKARERDSKMQYCFKTALNALQKYPLPLESGRDCKILNGFGDKLCSMLDEKLKKYKAENPDFRVTTAQITLSTVQSQPKRKPCNRLKTNTPPKEYVPKYQSGAFAILVTLHEQSVEPDYPGYLTKKQIIEMGQHLCSESFTKPLPDTWYTAWSSMKTLLEKDLVRKKGNPARFSLTTEGETLADKLHIQHQIEQFQKEEEKEPPNPLMIDKLTTLGSCDDLAGPSGSGLSSKTSDKCKGSSPKKKKAPIWKQTSSTSSTTSQTSNNAVHETVIIAPNTFEVILLVDNQELSGGRIDLENDPLIKDLKNLNVRHEPRNLKVGDYAWICRDNSDNEVILPYIIERKRMDDLGESIKDGRFHEQKFRLKQCGIENVIYLVENFGKNERLGLPITTLHQAAINTLIHDGFSVRFTENGRASCEYLASLTVFLNTLFKDKTLVSCSKEDLPPLVLTDDLIHLMMFRDFNKSSSKSRHFKVKEMFIKQLLQIKGMSVDKAIAIVEKYPTPRLLKINYDELLEEHQREKLLSNIPFGTSKKNVGLVLSTTVYQLFCKNTY